MAKLDKLVYLGNSFLMELANGIVEMATWDKREPGSIAGTSTTMSHRYMSKFTARLV